MPHPAEPWSTQAAGVSPSPSIDPSLSPSSRPTSSSSLALDAESSLASQRSLADTQQTSLPSSLQRPRAASPPTLAEDGYASIQVEEVGVTPRACLEAELQKHRVRLQEIRRKKAELAEEEECILPKLKDAELSLEEYGDEASDLPPASYYLRMDFHWSRKAKRTAAQLGYELRPVQEQMVNAILDGKHNVIGALPTGFGKSACFQVPPLLQDRQGLTLVVMPYTALMNDQVMELKRRGFGDVARCLHWDTPESEKRAILEDVRSDEGRISLLMVAPERFANTGFKDAVDACYAKGRLERLVLDEVHCLVMQGHRPEYLNLAHHLENYKVPIAAFSATLTEGMIEVIVRLLPRLKSHLLFRAPVSRPNLCFSVLLKPHEQKSAIQAVVDLVAEYPPNTTGIVYVNKTTLVKDYAEALAERLGRDVQVYHGKLTEEEKRAAHERWSRGGPCLVVATNAFGTGINRGDVRFVVHATCPKSIVDYVQEAGRAGRDGARADCVLFWAAADFDFALKLVLEGVGGSSADMTSDQMDHVANLFRYAEGGQCRAQFIASCFSSALTPSIESCAELGGELCDVCAHDGARGGLLNVDAEGAKVLKCAERHETMNNLGKVAFKDTATARRVVAAAFVRGDLSARRNSGGGQVYVTYTVKVRSSATAASASTSLFIDPALKRFEARDAKVKKAAIEAKSFKASEARIKLDDDDDDKEDWMTYDGIDTPPRPSSPAESLLSDSEDGHFFSNPRAWRKHQRLTLFADERPDVELHTVTALTPASRLPIEPNPNLGAEVEIEVPFPAPLSSRRSLQTYRSKSVGASDQVQPRASRRSRRPRELSTSPTPDPEPRRVRACRNDDRSSEPIPMP